MNDSRKSTRTRREGRLLEVVRRALWDQQMVQAGETVVVGVSGGPDSMCLLDLLHRLAPSLGITLVVAHLDHGLRGTESEQDFSFVEEQSGRYGVRFEGKRVHATSYGGRSNLQAKARERRYDFFEEVAAKWGAGKIATGHHQDDQVETLLLQLLRGAGVARGIVPVRDGRYIRPLLGVTRDEILNHARTGGVPFREDSSNSKGNCLRNRLRLGLIPQIRKEVNPAFGAALCRFFSILREEGDALDALSRDLLLRALESPGPEELGLRRDLLASAPLALRRRVIRLAFERVAGSTRHLSFAHVQRVCDLLEGTGKRHHARLALPGAVQVFFDHERVLLSRSSPWENIPYRYDLLPGEALSVPEAGVVLVAHFVPVAEPRRAEWNQKNEVLVSLPSQSVPLAVRNFRPGDRFRPIGLGGEKKLQDLFVDLKVPKSRRYRVPILEVGGKIAWVVGFRLDEGFKLSSGTVDCLRVRVSEWGGGGG